MIEFSCTIETRFSRRLFTTATSKSNLFFFYLIISGFISTFFFRDLVRVVGVPSYSWFIVNEYGFVLIPSIIFLALNKSLRDSLSLRALNLSSTLVVTLISLLAIFLILPVTFLSNVFYHNFIGGQVQQFYSLPYWEGLFAIGITPAICEEMAMRGVILSGYKNADVKSAVMANAFFFGVFHMNPDQFFYTFLLGIILAYLVEITDSILSSMIVHFLNNSLMFTLGYFMLNDKENTTSPSHYSMIISVITFLVISMLSLLVIILLLKKLRKINKNKLKTFMPTLNENPLQTVTWPVYASVATFVGFMVFSQIIGKGHIFK